MDGGIGRYDYCRLLFGTAGEILMSFAESLARRSESYDPRVSVIVPSLAKGIHADRLPKLIALLNDLCEQTLPPSEVLVGFDGENATAAKAIKSLGLPHVRCFHSPYSGAWGHPQTRLGIEMATGSLVVRLNDDNLPGPNYLRVLADQFLAPDVDISIARVIFAGEARHRWADHFGDMTSFVLPPRRLRRIDSDSIDCMNFMVRRELALRFVDDWSNEIDGDWKFLESLLRSGARWTYDRRIIGRKC